MGGGRVTKVAGCGAAVGSGGGGVHWNETLIVKETLRETSKRYFFSSEFTLSIIASKNSVRYCLTDML